MILPPRSHDARAGPLFLDFKGLVCKARAQNMSPTSETPTRAGRTLLNYSVVLAVILYLDRVCISTAAPAIKADLGLDDAQMGYVFSAFTLAYALFEVPSGWLADRFGARSTLARIVLWWSAMTAATGAATGFASLVSLRALFGMGEAGVLPSLTRAFGRWHSRALRPAS